MLIESAAVMRSIISRRHFNNDDFSIIIPYELMEQEKRESRIYNLLLASIAAISLLGWRNWHHEHYACHCHGKDTGDWYQAGCRRKKIRYNGTVCH